MNKISCDIIKDLLPLYVDGVCSENSKEIIEIHLADCDECKKYFELLTMELPEIENDNREDVAFLDGVKRKIQKEVRINRLAAIVASVSVMIILAAAFWTGGNYRYDFAFVDNRLDAADVEVKEIYELENGDIYFTLESDKKISWPSMTTLTYEEYQGDETDFYSTASLIYSWWSEYIEKTPVFYSCSYVYPKKIWAINEYDQEKLRENSAIYFKGKGDEREVIWMDIMDLEKAPENVEQKVNAKRENTDDYLGFAFPNYE